MPGVSGPPKVLTKSAYLPPAQMARPAKSPSPFDINSNTVSV